jgi:hypothetical protein
LPLLLAQQPKPPAPTVVVAEGEKFTPRDDKGWKPAHQDDSYGSHTYGGMWMSQGGCLAAPADSAGSLAVQAVTIPVAGKYRVWSKYQAPPYFNYLHRIEVHQGGKQKFAHDYGKKGTDRLWSFSGTSDELWWPWGVDHDTAEGAATLADLDAGPAEIRLITLPNPKPAGDRFVDFVLLTTNPADDYVGFKPYAVGTPFANEALAATKLYLRFKHTAAAPAQLTLSRAGHFQPNYGGATMKAPEQPLAPNTWSPWINIGPFCRLVHDEGVTLTLPGGREIEVEVARDEAGKDGAGKCTVSTGEAILIPVDITWNAKAEVKPSHILAQELMLASNTWRTADGGKKARLLRFYGAFGGSEPWVVSLKDRLGYNTELPGTLPALRPDHVAQHHGTAQAIHQLAKSLKPEDRERLHVVSFGDEIGLGTIDFKAPANQAKFQAWLRQRGVTEKDLGMPIDKATLTESGNARLVWYSNLFNEQERFAEFRKLTELVETTFGPKVLTGANYSPHHLALCYGPVFQWVDIFKVRGMSMIWAEDYIFSVPEVPQMLSFMFAQMRCGAKYHNLPIHFYVMPHSPGQLPGYLRRNMLYSAAAGAKHLDNFWVGPEERFTENYVRWGATDTWKALHESIHDTTAVEDLLVNGKLRPAKVAVVIGKATDFNESRLMVAKGDDPFTKVCKNAPEKVNQILCRKEQQLLYLALRHAQHGVDLITEDDIAERGDLAQYSVVYFAGEWADTRIVPKLEAWIKDGGTLVATGGIGHKNQYDEPDPALPALLGVTTTAPTKNLAVLRTLLELPLAEPIDTLTLGGAQVPAIGMKQVLTPAAGTKVLATWSDGKPAATVRELGKGKAIAIGTLAGVSYYRTAVKPIPWARGGRHTVYNPTAFSEPATKLVRLGVTGSAIAPDARCSVPGVEALLRETPDGKALLTLVNWTDAPVKGLRVELRVPMLLTFQSTSGKVIMSGPLREGVQVLTLDLDEADYLVGKR